MLTSWACLFLIPCGMAVGGSTTDQLYIQATVTPWLEYRILLENSSQKIIKKNVQRGYTNEITGTLISVSTNSLRGYILSVHCQAENIFTSVAITTDSGTCLAAPGSMVEIQEPYNGSSKDITRMDYRFNLSPAAYPDYYIWPIV